MGSYEVVRSVIVAAAPEEVHALVDDFHEWTAWSPWEGLDPDLERSYTGPATGIGSRYAWSGNRKAGAGSMEITGSMPERIDVALEFLKPFKNSTKVWFTFTPAAPGQTEVTWHMAGETTGAMAFVGKLVPMDRLVGKDFEKGLARLRTAAEQ